MRVPNMYGLLTASALLIGANSASALTLTADDLGSAGVEVSLTDAGTPGLINFAGIAGGFDLVISTGLGAPLVGGAGDAEIDLSVQTTVGNAGTLRVTLEDTGLSILTGATPNNVDAISDLGINALNDASVTVESFIRVGGGLFEALSSLASGTSVDLQETIRGTLASGALFDLRTVITVVHNSKFSTASADANLNVAPVPLPAALPLFLTALVGLGFVGRQRRKQIA